MGLKEGRVGFRVRPPRTFGSVPTEAPDWALLGAFRALVGRYGGGLRGPGGPLAPQRDPGPTLCPGGGPRAVGSGGQPTVDEDGDGLARGV